MAILSWLYLKLGLIGSILLGMIILLLFYTGYLYFSLNSLQNKYIDTTNILAKTDSLKEVLVYNNHSLSERYANQSKDLNNEIESNKILKKYVKDKDVEIKILANKIEEFRIINEALYGIISIDTAGNKVADFDTTTKEYSLQASTQVEPIPYLKIHSLVVKDSSSIFIGRLNENGLLIGGITHSNKYVRDSNADFTFQLTDKEGWIPATLTVSWICIPISIGIGALISHLLIR